MNFIKDSNNIKNFLWKINYTIPYANQIDGLEQNKEYEVKKDNKFFSKNVEFESTNLNIISDILLFEPKLISNFINKLDGLKKINISINSMEPPVFDIEEDDWIKEGLKNPNWETAMFDPADPNDLADIKFIRESIDPNIQFDFIHLGKTELEILKEHSII